MSWFGKKKPTSSDKQKKQSIIWSYIIVLLLILASLFLFFQRRATRDLYAARSLELLNLSSLDITLLQRSNFTKNQAPWRRIANDIVDVYDEIVDEKERFEDYFISLSDPYTHFLQHLYLPSLNIRKDPYTKEINSNLIWIEFLENNPYTDIDLIQKRSNFFKDVWSTTQFNEINDIRIKPITENIQGDFFAIPITLTFESPDKRSFLMLVEKLSMTSNKENISLMNEFFYHLREVIKRDRSLYLSGQVYTQWAMADNPSINQKIGYELFNRITKEQENNLVDDQILETAIRNTAWCNQETQEHCYYLFRDKMRTLPFFAYQIARRGIDKVQWFKNYFSQLPPIIWLERFTFNRVRQSIALGINQPEYIGQITLKVFGRGVPGEDVTQIAKELWAKCYENDRQLDIRKAVEDVNKKIVEVGKIDSIDSERSKELIELRDLLSASSNPFLRMSNYNKIVKLFETYRMLSDANICDL